VVVAVVDSGVDGGHPDLVGRVLPGRVIMTNRPTRAGENSDNHGHGTAVAAIIAGDRDGNGITGVAPEATILPVHIGNRSGTSDDGTIAAGIDWAVAQDADVINLSLGGRRAPGDVTDDRLCDAVTRALAVNVVVVVSAGNSGGSGNLISMPGGCRGAVTVAAAGEDLQVASYSSFGAHVSVTAPGRRIIGSLKRTAGNFPYIQWDGTSVAAPVVTGVVALIRAAHPDWTARQVIAQLTGSALDIDVQGYDPRAGHGLVNAAAAVGLAASDIASLRERLEMSSTPSIVTAVRNPSSTTVRWTPPPGNSPTGYRIVHRAGSDLLRSYNVGGDQLRAELPPTVRDGMIVIVAETEQGDRVSFPLAVFDVYIPGIAPPVLPVVRDLRAQWVEGGVEVSLRSAGFLGPLTVTVKDRERGSTRSLIMRSGQEMTLFSYPAEHASRASSLDVTVTGGVSKAATVVTPQALITLAVTGKSGVLTASGSTAAACRTRGVGCRGSLVSIVDAQTGKVKARVRVSPNLTYRSDVFGAASGDSFVAEIGRIRSHPVVSRV
jgi:hypothetical protein